MSKKPSFAKAFADLEKIAEYFENDEVDLEEGVKKFEEGLELAGICKARLAEIENKVVEIKKKFGAEATSEAQTDIE